MLVVSVTNLPHGFPPCCELYSRLSPRTDRRACTYQSPRRRTYRDRPRSHFSSDLVHGSSKLAELRTTLGTRLDDGFLGLLNRYVSLRLFFYSCFRPRHFRCLVSSLSTPVTPRPLLFSTQERAITFVYRYSRSFSSSVYNILKIIFYSVPWRFYASSWFYKCRLKNGT